MSERLVRMRAPASMGGAYREVPASEVDQWRKKGAVVAPEQNAGELVSRATRSVNPVEIVRGLRDVAADPAAAASGLASLPGDLAGQAWGDLRQGNYLRAARKGFEAALPIAGGVGGAVLGIPGGPMGVIGGGLAGYAAGSGVAAGLDEGVDNLEEGNWATGTGAFIDAGVQGVLGARVSRPRPASNPASRADRLDQRVQTTTARTLGPTVGPNRYGWGNEARKLGPEILRRTKSNSVDGISQELAALRERANAGLDGAYDVAPQGVRMRTDVVVRGLLDEIQRLSVRDAQGNWIPLRGNAERVAALSEAAQEIRQFGPTLDAKSIRRLRQSWDKAAENVWEPKSNAGWDKVRESGHGYAAARDVLNDQTMRVYPHLKPQAADASFAIKATDLLRQLEETENARSRVARSTLATTGGAVVGTAMGGAAGTAMGAMAGWVTEMLVTQKLAPAAKIKAARIMADMADELRKNGRTATALSYGEQLRALVSPAAMTSRTTQAVESMRPALAASHEQEQPQQSVRMGQTVMVGGEPQLVMKVNSDGTFEAVPKGRK